MTDAKLYEVMVHENEAQGDLRLEGMRQQAS